MGIKSDMVEATPVFGAGFDEIPLPGQDGNPETIVISTANEFSSLRVDPPMPKKPAKKDTEFVDLTAGDKNEESVWIDQTTALFNVFQVNRDESETKISVVIKVFSNNNVLVTITDADRFGSTFSAKKV